MQSAFLMLEVSVNRMQIMIGHDPPVLMHLINNLTINDKK